MILSARVFSSQMNTIYHQTGCFHKDDNYEYQLTAQIPDQVASGCGITTQDHPLSTYHDAVINNPWFLVQNIIKWAACIWKLQIIVKKPGKMGYCIITWSQVFKDQALCVVGRCSTTRERDGLKLWLPMTGQVSGAKVGYLQLLFLKL